ncbi:hypothetical protein PSEUBRA_003661 [Kalmanozyma brasiliensis GHG001]|uniref:uncharacterized protein n=1 Tax=Kalmanozyma brasiliensis (strain GHG001) TaxID=1365824 RepID=UPI002868006C|nr:uncharacterized protein PSEUBRA_003661 [Kalmanozyma brasiliensis GHG001]EST06867.2 hypothetical protein PSEUBRA_003661 [Kalmanozyma brasiliensis GHG001]
MLQSNTDATSFKLQPAPRPKSKKRPQNPPPVLTLSPNASASTDGADTKSLRSCFEDEDEAITPKASSFHIFLDDKHDVSDSDATISSRRLRSSSTSISSATSTKSLSSVNRLLSALSPTTPTRRPQSLTSPSATVTVMLTNKSPTPSSPLFPRRTLMRSLSSTCVNIRSPTTPLTPSPGATLRKRMGWRGAQSAQLADETAIIMSPGSPLTPRRADALHTPTQASISSIPENEPLSATLKALGAKRRTERFASTCAPLLSPDGADVKSPNSEKFELMTATRKIFHLPTWVRFEAKHHARTQAAEENRQAAAGFEELRKKISTESMMEYVVMRGEALPKTSQLGDNAPASPNGELLAGFGVDTLHPSRPKTEVKEEGECVISVVRRPTMAALREGQASQPTKKASGGVFGAVRSALPGIRPQRRIRDSRPPKPLLLAPASLTDPERRDGWGGILTRSSWFPSFRRGPLVSPTPSGAMLLQPLPRGKREDDEWEDIDEPVLPTDNEPTSFLELNDAPRFFNRSPATTGPRGWFPFSRSPPKDWIGETRLDTWHTRPLKPSHEEESVSSEMITRGGRSVENRPLGKKKGLRTRIVMAAVIVMIVAAVVANVVIIAQARKVSQGQGDKGRMAYDPLVGRIGPGFVLPPTMTTTVPDARSSSVARAAQLSQP